ncbi:hypothetical protein FOCC_FOCC015574 [Frankliniella occidentalis]|nr:hypothetical protein FOCC_FOCC015574 [Frankliniella occidentalis]
MDASHLVPAGGGARGVRAGPAAGRGGRARLRIQARGVRHHRSGQRLLPERGGGGAVPDVRQEDQVQRGVPHVLPGRGGGPAVVRRLRQLPTTPTPRVTTKWRVFVQIFT